MTTSSPGRHDESPDSATPPDPSADRTRGGSTRCAPLTSQTSRWFNDAARIETVTAPCGVGTRGRSSSRTPEGPVGSRYTTQRPELSTSTASYGSPARQPDLSADEGLLSSKDRLSAILSAWGSEAFSIIWGGWRPGSS